MTTEEFIEAVEKLGFRVKIYDTTISVNNSDEYSSPLATISRRVHCRVETNFDAQKGLTEELRKKLYSLIFEYTLTPILDRGDRLRYYLKLKKSNNERERYLNQSLSTGNLYIGEKYESPNLKTQFTKEEAKAILPKRTRKFFIKEAV